MISEPTIDHLMRLHNITAALTSALTPRQVTEVIVQQGVIALRAAAGFTSLLGADGTTLQIIGLSGYDEELTRGWHPTPLTLHTPTTHAARTGQAVWLESAAALAEQYPQLAARPAQTGNRAFVALPLQGAERVIGVLGFSFPDERSFSLSERAFMEALAHQGALALEHARLYEAEHAARRSAERAQERLTFLANASDVLAASLDYETTLRSLMRLVVPTLADWCVLDIIAEPAASRRVIIAHVTPSHARAVHIARRSQALDADSTTLIERLIETRQPIHDPQLPPDILLSLTNHAPTLAHVRRLRGVTRLVLPLIARNVVIGALTLFMARPSREFETSDLALAQVFAMRVALNLDNSSLYQAMVEAERRSSRQATRMQALATLAHQFSAAALDFPTLLETIAAWIIDDVGNGCIIYLQASDTQELVPVLVRHSNATQQRAWEERLGPVHRGEGIQGSVAETGQPLALPPYWGSTLRAQLNAIKQQDSASYKGQTALILPLQHGAILGTLTILRDPSWPEFSAEEENFLSEVAERAVIALDNAELHRRLQEREQHLSDLVGRLLTSQEEERRRVAYDVHDGVAQISVAVHQQLQAFAQGRRPRSPHRRTNLDLILSLAQKAVDEARIVIADLRPTVLDDFGLAAALSMQVEALRRADWEITYRENLGDARLPAQVETTLFRVAQEALTNVRKHAQTTTVLITLNRHSDAVRLHIRDWGRGFDPAHAGLTTGPGERVGLPGIRERIALLSGHCHIETAPHHGTSVTATIPLGTR